jgi:hypothetical protein
VPRSQLLRDVLREGSVRVLHGAGLLFLVGGIFVWAASDDRIWGIAVAAFGVLLALVPIVYWRRLVNSLEHDPVGHAEVLDVQIEAPSRATIDAIKNGMARGTWRVSTAGEPSFVETFEVDEAFALQIRPGTLITVLVSSRRKKTTFPLALMDARQLASRP